jgi:hypothetical protein
MALIPKVVGTLSCVLLMLLGGLAGCTIGKGPRAKKRGRESLLIVSFASGAHHPH